LEYPGPADRSYGITLSARCKRPRFRLRRGVFSFGAKKNWSFQKGPKVPDVFKTTSPKRPRNDSSNEPLGLDKNFAAKESENLGSVRLALGGCPVARLLNDTIFALSVNTPSEFSVTQKKTKQNKKTAARSPDCGSRGFP